MPPSSQSGQSSKSNRQLVPISEFVLYTDPEEGSFELANQGGTSLKSHFLHALVGQGNRQWSADDPNVAKIMSILDTVQKPVPEGASAVTREDFAGGLNIDDEPHFGDVAYPFVTAASKLREVLKLTALKVFADSSSSVTAKGNEGRKPGSVPHSSGRDLILHLATYGLHIIGNSTNVADVYRDESEEWYDNGCGYPHSVGANSWEEEENGDGSLEWTLKAAVWSTERFLQAEWNLWEARQFQVYMTGLREEATFIKSILEYSIQHQLKAAGKEPSSFAPAGAGAGAGSSSKTRSNTPRKRKQTQTKKGRSRQDSEPEHGQRINLAKYIQHAIGTMEGESSSTAESLLLNPSATHQKHHKQEQKQTQKGRSKTESVSRASEASQATDASEAEQQIKAFIRVRAKVEELETIIDTEFLADVVEEKKQWSRVSRQQGYDAKMRCAVLGEDVEQLFRLGYKGLERALDHALQQPAEGDLEPEAAGEPEPEPEAELEVPSGSDAPTTHTIASRYLPLMFPLENESEQAKTARLATLRYLFEKEQQKLDAAVHEDSTEGQGKGHGKHPESDSESGEASSDSEDKDEPDEPEFDAGIAVSYLSRFILPGQTRPLKSIENRKEFVPAMVDELAYDRARAFQKGSRLYSASENLRRGLESWDNSSYNWIEGIELNSLINELQTKYADFIPGEIDFRMIQQPENYNKAISQFGDLQPFSPSRTTNERRGVFMVTADPDLVSTGSAEELSEPDDLDLASIIADLDNISVRSS